ncbi:hypothetical protein KQI63_02180 [bacterium]|nr:hypothetical protein [bacterium]
MTDSDQKTRLNRFEDVKSKAPDLATIERKVGLVIELVAELRKENQQLRSSIQSVEKERDSLTARIDGLENELARARANGRDRTKEETIRKKVEGLLQRLEEL